MVLASSIIIIITSSVWRLLTLSTAEGPIQAKGVEPDIKVRQELPAEASYSSWAGWRGCLC